MDRRRPLLVNEGEFRTDQALREAAATVGYGVHTKVRVADALSIDRSGLSAEAYSYALRSHFDWVVTDVETTKPEFAVEFDGDSNVSYVARRGDALKDEVSERLGLPLLRIDRAGFRPTIRRTVIGYLVESWAMWKGFNDAQENGVIPLDEIFEPWAFIEDVDQNGNIVWRDMAAPMRNMVVGRVLDDADPLGRIEQVGQRAQVRRLARAGLAGHEDVRLRPHHPCREVGHLGRQAAGGDPVPAVAAAGDEVEPQAVELADREIRPADRRDDRVDA